MTAVLVVEDDPDIWRSLEMLLGRAGYRALWATDGVEGLERFAEERPDLVVLDVALPRLDGWQVLERIRYLSDVPVLVLTARGLESDKVRGLLAGADDYLTEPYGNDELVARVGALLRRKPADTTDATVYDDGRVQADFASEEVRVGGRRVELTTTELRLLATLVRHAGDVVPHARLLETVWRVPSGSDRSRIKFAVHGLRKKCGWDDLASSPLQTVRGFGYRYVRPGPGISEARRPGPP